VLVARDDWRGPCVPANESVYCQEPFALLSASRFSNNDATVLSEVEVLAVLAVSVVNVPLGTVGAEPLPLHVPVTGRSHGLGQKQVRRVDLDGERPLAFLLGPPAGAGAISVVWTTGEVLPMPGQVTICGHEPDLLGHIRCPKRRSTDWCPG